MGKKYEFVRECSWKDFRWQVGDSFTTPAAGIPDTLVADLLRIKNIREVPADPAPAQPPAPKAAKA
jgi:hypothetical protein